MKGSGASILLTVDAKGRFLEGTIVGTPKPGTVMQLDPGVAPVGSRYSYIPYAAGADGNPPVGEMLVLLPDNLQGFDAKTAYITGSRGFLYAPLPGDELNMLVAGQAGTGSANEFDIGDRLIPQNATGKLVLEGTASHSAPFVCMEEITETVNTDTLVFCQFTGSV